MRETDTPRDLRIVGLEPGGEYVICEDPQSGQRMRLAIDDRFKAAARGDALRFGQIEIEMESGLRPREIQSRIRAGQSVQQIADEAGVAVSRIERFAHPVILERQRAASLAGGAHPVRGDGPAVDTLAEVVSTSLITRGHSADSVEWDAWKGADGQWIVQITWLAGKSENQAHFTFAPGSHGGTVHALNDAARQLIDPDFVPAPLRVARVAPIELNSSRDVAPSRDASGASRSSRQVPRQADERAHSTDEAGDAADGTASQSRRHIGRGRRPKTKPEMPSWEDVLLGVRGNH